VAGADDLVLDAELVAQSDVESGGQHDEARGQLLAIRERDVLTLRPGREAGDLGVNDIGALGNLRTHGVDQHVVEDAALRHAGQHVDDTAAARHQAIGGGGRGGDHGRGKAGQPQRLQLDVIDLLAAEIRRIDRMRVDQNGIDAGTAQHRGRERTREAATGNDNIGVPQLHLPDCRWG
jgi:hypothetical protein